MNLEQWLTPMDDEDVVRVGVLRRVLRKADQAPETGTSALMQDVTVEVAAGALHLSVSAVRTLIREGRLHAFKSGKRYLVPRDALRAFQEARRAKAIRPAAVQGSGPDPATRWARLRKPAA